MQIRVGHGYDSHRFGAGEFITLGGEVIPFHQGFIAHSDGDVIIHALCDAMLGAIACGDIGQHFPDDDQQYSNANSRVFLRKVTQLVKDNGYILNNIDITVLAEAPKIKKYSEKMIKNIANDTELQKSCINIKAKSNEGMGFVGNKEGIAAHVVVLVVSL